MDYSEYYIKLPIPDNFTQIQDDVNAELTSNTNKDHTGIYFFKINYYAITSLNDYLLILGLNHSIKEFAFSLCKSADQFHIHTDPDYYKWVLVLPIENYTQTTTKFFRSSKLPYENSIINDEGQLLKWNHYDPNDTTEVCSFITESPTFINTHEPHTIINNGKAQRSALLVRFVPEFDPSPRFVSTQY